MADHPRNIASGSGGGPVQFDRQHPSGAATAAVAPAAPQEAAARPGVRTIVFGNPFSQEIAHGAKAIGSSGQAAVASFRTKPGQSGALLMGYVAWCVMQPDC